MFRIRYNVIRVGAVVLWFSAAASAETLRCQAVNGNLNCAGSDGVSCQTVNGARVCTSGHGDVVQSFGKILPPDMPGIDTEGDDSDPAELVVKRRPKLPPRGHGSLLERDGTRLRTDWQLVERD